MMGATNTAGRRPEQPRIKLGFVPLSDCAPLVIAHELGYFARHGLEVTLSREVSWANIRDKVAAGLLDGAHMLSAMPLATTLGLGEVQQPTITALSLDLNGNAITVSEALYQRLQGYDLEEPGGRPVTAEGLKRLILAERSAGKPPLTFAMVFPFSTHNYLLRYWLAAAGIDPERDIRLIVIPPPQMVDHLKSGMVDGFCVGEPWNAAAVAAGLGRVLVTDYEIWNNKPEKVLGVNASWADKNPRTHRALLMALLEAGQWLDVPSNRTTASAILSGPDYVDVPAEIIGMSLHGCFRYASSQPALPLPDFNVFHRYAASFPWRSHAIWLLTQMIRWGQIDHAVDIRGLATAVYRPDLYRAAAAELGISSPASDEKIEGEHPENWLLPASPRAIPMGPDRFIDGMVFDPSDPLDYLNGFAIHHRKSGSGALDAMNSVKP